MRATAALRKDFVPADGLPRALGLTDFRELDQRLRDSTELEKLRQETKSYVAEVKDAAAWLAEHSKQPAPDDLDAVWLAQAAKKAQEKGNKRTAFAAMRLFLLANGYDTILDDDVAWADEIIALVERRIAEEDFVRAIRPFVVER